MQNKISSQNLWDQRKSTKEAGLSSIRVFKLKKKIIFCNIFIYNYKYSKVVRPVFSAFSLILKFLTWYLIFHGQNFTDKIITICRMSNIRHSTEANFGSQIESNLFAHLQPGCSMALNYFNLYWSYWVQWTPG